MTMSKNYFGKWGILRFSTTPTWEEAVHPDDCEKLRENMVDYSYECIGYESQYLFIKSRRITIRVLPEAFVEIPSPRYSIGEKVYIKDSIPVTIATESWHEKDQKHFYLVEKDSKRSSKRIFEEDISPVIE